MSYLYIKKTPVAKRSLDPKIKKIGAGFFLIAGIFLFTSAVLPIVRFQLEYSLKLGQIINPLSTHYYNRSGNILGELTTDYTQINNWFVTEENAQNTQSIIGNTPAAQYHLSIPSLKINDAVVDIGSMDLKKSLIQYPQTALPGQAGNAVVFGHSVLPQFFNPKSYLTIFSTLYRLKTGDEILIDFDSVRYKYLVEEMFEVQPTELHVLDQRYDSRYLTLITCSPPGTYLRRLVVRARIADNTL